MEPIKDYPMYTIDEQGNVFSLFKHRLLKPNNNAGYLMVWLSKFVNNEYSKISRWEYIHRLVAINFLPDPLPGQIWVNHKNGNKADNNVNNLEWSTISDNIQHSYTTLKRTVKRGSGHWLYGKKATIETKGRMSDSKKLDWQQGKYKNRKPKKGKS